MEATMNTRWVIGAYTGERAKSVKSHADAGLGYFIQQEAGAGQNYTVTAALRWPITGPLPEHLQHCTLFQINKLDALLEARSGIQTRI